MVSIQDNTTKLQELLNKANALPTSLDTSDATATAEDMVNGVTAYVNGEKVTGTIIHETLIHVYGSGELRSRTNNGEKQIGLLGYGSTEKRRVFGDGAGVITYIPALAYGDATSENVAEGKTFTSASGLKVTGTHKCSGGYAIKTGTTTSATIDTGLSSIKQLILYKTSLTATGLVQATYNEEVGTSYVYCSSYSSYSQRCSIGTAKPTVSGGTFNWTGSSTQGLTNGVTYNWIAIGEE